MENKYFFTNVEVEDKNKAFVELIKQRSFEKQELTYLLSKPLLEFDGVPYANGMLLMIKGYRMILLGFYENDDDFNNFCDDVQEDVSFFITQFEYKSRIGRPREWWKDVVKEKNNVSESDLLNFIEECKINNNDLIRKANLIFGLLTGSINDNISNLELESPKDILSAVKNKIMLFDADQTNFIFGSLNKKTILIQGLAGTGKTELLLHKIRELYTAKKKENIVAFTCFNKVLAKELRKRVPVFFNSMKVNEQIKWNERLFLFSSWGSSYDKTSGFYSYLCNYYNLPFQGWSYTTEFKDVCKTLYEQLQELKDFNPCFDYLFVDEGQDFTQDFFDLCELVTKKHVYVAMDIFQNVFMHNENFSIAPDYALSNCYRTDPKTLIVSHAMGLALLEEKPRLGWLDEDKCSVCGYNYCKNEDIARISRVPLKRFDDIECENNNSIQLFSLNINDYVHKIVEIIKLIKQNYVNVKPEDVAIVFLESLKSNYEIADKIEYAINTEIEWKVKKGYIDKEKCEDHLFLTNINNVKGLEFPFVICFSIGTLPKTCKIRNSLYMILTRSFINSYFIFDEGNKDFYSRYTNCIEQLNENNYIEVIIPDENERKLMQDNIIKSEMTNKTTKDLVEELLKEMDVPKNEYSKFHTFIQQNYKDGYDTDKIKEMLEGYNELIKRLIA